MTLSVILAILKDWGTRAPERASHQSICNASPALQQKNVHEMTPCMLVGAFPCTQKHARPLNVGGMVVDHVS